MVTTAEHIGNTKLYQINKNEAMVRRLIKLLCELYVSLAERKNVKKEIPIPKKISSLSPKSTQTWTGDTPR